MKKILGVAAILVMAAACQRALVPVNTPLSHTEIKNNSGQLILAGHEPIAVLQEPLCKPWYDKSYDSYTVDTNTTVQLKPLLKDYSIDIFLGSWCGDSKREVPRMMKLLQVAGMDTAKVSLIFVDNTLSRYKQSPAHEENNKNIHHVPTFIFYENQHETGRIVESPVGSLEKDMLQIFTQKNYIPNYRGIQYWLNLPRRQQAMSDQQLQGLVSSVKPLCKHYGEFNTYGYVLLSAGKKAEALNAFRLNTLMYPETPGVFDSLGEAYATLGNKPAAISAYEKVLSLKPDDANAKIKLAQLKE